MANRISLDGTVFHPETRYSQTTGKPVLNFDLSFYDGKAYNKFGDDGKAVNVPQDPAGGQQIDDEEIPF